MLDSVRGILGGVLPINNEFTEGVNETPEDSETKEINNSEGVEYGEADIERIEAAADIMGEIFTDEVISNWENLSVEERTSYLNEYYTKAGQALGIDTKEVYVEDLQEKYGYGVQGVNNGDGNLGIDISIVADPSQLEELLNTTTHEMRHQFQNEVLKNPDAFPDISQETLDQWQYELTNYIDPSYDFEGYQNQAIETDARAFAEEVVDDFLSDVENDAYSVTKSEDDLPEGLFVNDEQMIDQVEMISTERSFDPDHVDAVEKAFDIPDDKSVLGQEGDIELDENLNRNTFSYTPGQCAKISTGTQNYCLFAGSGR